MDFSQISLFVATPEQVKVHRERTFVQWGRGLSLEEYIKRDEAFDGLAHSAGGKFVVWVLAPRENPTSNVDFFCSCETYRREAAVSHISSKDNAPVAYGVASVFTPAENRRKGYAKHMMRLLHYILADQRPGSTYIPPFPVDKWGPPPIIPAGFGVGIASALYSDVGPMFYQSCGISLREDNGWIVHRPYSTVWPVRVHDGINETDLEWLTEEMEDDAWEEDAEVIRKEVGASAPAQACFSFLPHKGVAKYQQARSLFFVPTSNKATKWGIRLKRKDPGDVALSFATWCLDPGRQGPKTLLITRLRCTPAELSVILNAAFQAASSFGLEQVEIWNLDAALQKVGADLGGVTSARDDHLSSLAWYGHTGGDKVEWRYNEKFCWC